MRRLGSFLRQQTALSQWLNERACVEAEAIAKPGAARSFRLPLAEGIAQISN